MIYNYMDPKKFIEDEKSRNSEISKHKAYSMYYKTFIFNKNNNIVFLLRSMGQFIKFIFSVFFSKINVFRIAIIYFYINNFVIGIYCSDDNDEEPPRKKIKNDNYDQQLQPKAHSVLSQMYINDIVKHIDNQFFNHLKTIRQKLFYYMGQLYNIDFMKDDLCVKHYINIKKNVILISLLSLDFSRDIECSKFILLKEIPASDIKIKLQDEKNRNRSLLNIENFLADFLKAIKEQSNNNTYLQNNDYNNIFIKHNEIMDVIANNKIHHKNKIEEKFNAIIEFWFYLWNNKLIEKKDFFSGQNAIKCISMAYKQINLLSKDVYIGLITKIDTNPEIINEMSSSSLPKNENNKYIPNNDEFIDYLKFLVVFYDIFKSEHLKQKNQDSSQKTFDKCLLDKYERFQKLFYIIYNFSCFAINMEPLPPSFKFNGEPIVVRDIFDEDFPSYIELNKNIENLMQNNTDLGLKEFDTNISFIKEFLFKFCMSENPDPIKSIQNITYSDDDFESYIKRMKESSIQEIKNIFLDFNIDEILKIAKNGRKFYNLVQKTINFYKQTGKNEMESSLFSYINDEWNKLKYNIYELLITENEHEKGVLDAQIQSKIEKVYIFYFITDKLSKTSKLSNYKALINIFEKFKKFNKTNAKVDLGIKKLCERFFVSFQLLMRIGDILKDKYPPQATSSTSSNNNQG